jgi:hypothetical protein
VKILDIFIFCSVPPYESVYTVDRDTTTDTDNTNNNFFAYFAIAKLKYCIFYLCTQISPKYITIECHVPHSKSYPKNTSLYSVLPTSTATATTITITTHTHTCMLRIHVILQSAGAVVSVLLLFNGDERIVHTIFTHLIVIKHGFRWPLRDLILS